MIDLRKVWRDMQASHRRWFLVGAYSSRVTRRSCVLYESRSSNPPESDKRNCGIAILKIRRECHFAARHV